MNNKIKISLTFIFIFWGLSVYSQNSGYVKGSVTCNDVFKGNITYQYEGRLGNVSAGATDKFSTECYYILKKDTVFFYYVRYYDKKVSSFMSQKMAVLNFCKGTEVPGSIEIRKNESSYQLYFNPEPFDNLKTAIIIDHVNGSTQKSWFARGIEGWFRTEEEARAFLKQVQTVMVKYKAMFKTKN